MKQLFQAAQYPELFSFQSTVQYPVVFAQVELSVVERLPEGPVIGFRVDQDPVLIFPDFPAAQLI